MGWGWVGVLCVFGALLVSSPVVFAMFRLWLAKYYSMRAHARERSAGSVLSLWPVKLHLVATVLDIWIFDYELPFNKMECCKHFKGPNLLFEASSFVSPKTKYAVTETNMTIQSKLI